MRYYFACGSKPVSLDQLGVMKKDPKPPQEKKRLSLERDRRNDYGENAKASRKNIPRLKALSLRKERHGQNQALQAVTRAHSEDELVAAELRATSPKRRWWRKEPDVPLGKIVARKLPRRKP